MVTSRHLHIIWVHLSAVKYTYFVVLAARNLRKMWPAQAVGRRQGLCAEYKKCLNSTARVYLIGGSAVFRRSASNSLARFSSCVLRFLFGIIANDIDPREGRTSRVNFALLQFRQRTWNPGG